MSVDTQNSEALGYKALAVSRDRVGWNISFVSELDGTKNIIEVKGLSRSQAVVSLTRNEIRKAKNQSALGVRRYHRCPR